jgi:MoaA/NifB/PqqE/SkfB family radical SAM enzyme
MRSIPNIAIEFETFPKYYINDINGWGFDNITVKANKGRLLTLDIDFGDYCSLNCPFCFRLNNSIDEKNNELRIEDLKRIILEAKTLGLRSVKFLGKGDPFENKGFLDFLRFLHFENVIPLIFTKGQVIGDDEKVFNYFGEYKIFTGEQLANELQRLNASVMLGFASFDSTTQNKIVGQKNSNYTDIRNQALLNLVKAGLNKGNPTRLALAMNPITKWNIDEIFEIYKWGRRRNFYCIITPSMISGRAKDKTWVAITPSKEKLIDLYTEIYRFNIENGLQTIEQINDEGISAYAGGHPCNQVATGMYVSLNGVVLSCPGSEERIEGNIWEQELTEIWNQSENNIIRGGLFNCNCIAKDGKSIPDDLYSSVLKNLIPE